MEGLEIKISEKPAKDGKYLSSWRVEINGKRFGAFERHGKRPTYEEVEKSALLFFGKSKKKK